MPSLYGFIGALQPLHWLVVAVVVLLLFGNRLPSVMRSLGQGIVEFKKGLNDIDDDGKDAKGSAHKIEDKTGRN